MRRFVVQLAGLAPLVLLSTTLVFAFTELLPGDAATVLAGPDATTAVIDAIRADRGLDRPLPARYAAWLARILRGDLGVSFHSRVPVAELVATRIPSTVELAASATVLTALMALPLGLLAAVRAGRAADVGVRTWSAVAVAIPPFWLGLLLVLLFALRLGWLPAGGDGDGHDPLSHAGALVLPALTLALPAAAALARLVRTLVLEMLGRDHVRAARAKGLPERTVLLRHVLRGAALPLATMLGLSFGRLLGGSVIVESVFSRSGVGLLIVDAVGTRDYPLLQGTLLFYLAAFVVVSAGIEAASLLLDPRTRSPWPRRGRA